jgi:hypothetical protein
MKSINALCLLAILFSGSVCAKEWSFNVYFGDKEIGQQSYVLTEHEDGVHELVSNANFDVKLLGIHVYSYLHTADEKWQGDCLTSLAAQTNDNGDITAIKGKLGDDGFALEVGKNRKMLPACSMTFAYWNPVYLTQSKLLNPQTGEWLDVKIKSLGNESIEVRGQQTASEHYRIEGPKLKIDVWYSPDKEWLAYSTTVPQGVVSYKLR